MRSLILLVVAALLAVNAFAQMRKCVDADGKVTYSDVLCANTTTDTPIRIRDNTLDASGSRREMQGAQAAAERSTLAQRTPQECKFQYYEYGDGRGKVLAENAKAECIENKLAAKTGGRQSLVAYQLWKDNFDQVAARKQTNSVRTSIEGVANTIRFNQR